METITIIFPDGIETFCFEVVKKGYQDEIIWSEQADTLEEALEIIEKKELT